MGNSANITENSPATLSLQSASSTCERPDYGYFYQCNVCTAIYSQPAGVLACEPLPPTAAPTTAQPTPAPTRGPTTPESWVEWFGAGSSGLPSDSMAYGVAVDALGNSYPTGYYYKVFQILLANGTTTNFTNPSQDNHAYIMKVDPGGSVLWVQIFGDPRYNAEGNGVVVDRTTSDIFIVGDFYDYLNVSTCDLMCPCASVYRMAQVW